MSTTTTAGNRLPMWIVIGAAAALAPLEAWGMDQLPVGIVAEPTPLTLVLRVAAIAWGAVLLVTGVRRPVAALMSFYLALGLAIGLVTAGGRSYLLSLAIALASIIVATAMVTWARRVATAIACLWPLPAAYAVYLYFSGSFERSVPLAIGLAVAGAALGALWPRGGAALLAAALGTVLVVTGLPLAPTLLLSLSIPAASILWQLVVLDRVWQSPFEDIPSWPAQERRTPRRFTMIVRNTTAALAALVVVVILMAPQYGPASGPSPNGDRVASLIDDDLLTRPALVLSRGDNLYLSGRSTLIAIAAPNPGLLSRLKLPLMGRSASRAVHRLRAVKDADELETMRRAAAVTSQAFVDIAPRIRPGVNEGDIEAAIIESFRRNGATGIAFDAIVGSGENATLPHYAKNDAVMKDGLVVIDIGCSVDGYASDMTRTFPVARRLTVQQQELVDVVNSAGDAARAELRSGVTMRELDRAARQVIEDAGFGPFFLHGLGHHVGLDVHDPHAATLEAGMVITIEPGIYISSGSDIDPAYWDLGVRIEDSYIVTKDGYQEITSYPR
ncbi:MAG: Xaa-Pro peptidase family protein [Acidobacteriota bacterium]|nr:Xaa-Pro peptidase family protein [Acidobacteriota bacterium]